MNYRAGDLPDLTALAAWAPELAKTFVSLSSDIALIIDNAGVIQDVAQSEVDPLACDWVGQHWVDTVSADTRSKIERLLQEVNATGIARRREVNHLFSHGVNVPVAYSAIRLGNDGPVLATGRDLRAIAAIQQRFLDSQQEMERGYWQARQAETRYRLLFQVATDAVLVVDGYTLRIREANEAASWMFGIASEQMADRLVTAGFEVRSRAGIEELLIAARACGQSREIRAKLLGKVALTSVAATPFRADDTMRLLVRVRVVDDNEQMPALGKSITRLVDDNSDGVVITDSSGRVLMTSSAFLRLVRLDDETQANGRPITDWIGLPERPLATLLPQVRRDGLARQIPSWIKTGEGSVAKVHITASLLTEGDQECIGFTIHRVAPNEEDEASTYQLHFALQQLSSRLGKLPLDALTQEVVALAERHFAQAALDHTHDDLPEAARLLGISSERLMALRHSRIGPHEDLRLKDT